MSAIPEKPLAFYPQIAATLGLEGAVLIQVLKDLLDYGEPRLRSGFQWLEVGTDKLLSLLPFWSERDLQRVVAHLHDLGVLLIGSTQPRSGEVFHFALNERVSPPAVPARQELVSAARPISNQWQPEPDVIAQLGQYGIPREFALEQLPEFVTYWSERNEPRHSWGSKFIKQVLRVWRQRQAREARQSQEIAMHEGWRPSADAMEILTIQAGINGNFVEDAIPEFILYWQERGVRMSTWNSRFVQHVKRQWASYTHALKMDTEPRPMVADWAPDPTVYDVLEMANIERGFAQALIGEFRLYWLDRGELAGSWNTKFLQYVKRQWAYNHQQNSASSLPLAASANETQQRPYRSGSTRHRNLGEELTDRSWAD